MEELLKEVEALNNNTPDGYVTDADTILADAIGSADLEVTGIAQDVFGRIHQIGMQLSSYFTRSLIQSFQSIQRSVREKLRGNQKWMV